MPLIAINGSTCQCPFGTTTCKLVVLPHRRSTINNQPVATIMDHKVPINLATFGLCRTVTNPATAAATAAAMGALTPAPCLPVLPAPWVPGCPLSDIKSERILHEPSTVTCVYGGVIRIIDIPQKTCTC